MTSQLVSLVSRFGATRSPTIANFKGMLAQICRHVFLGKPLGLLYTMHRGVPNNHLAFWKSLTVSKFYQLYNALNATPTTVLHLLEEPEFENQAEADVYHYLTSFIGSCKTDELRSFLRFVTGSSVVLDHPLKVSFNGLSGLARRPTAHTCDCVLELPTTYETYMEFEQEFYSILRQEDSWLMDCV